MDGDDDARALNRAHRAELARLRGQDTFYDREVRVAGGSSLTGGELDALRLGLSEAGGAGGLVTRSNIPGSTKRVIRWLIVQYPNG